MSTDKNTPLPYPGVRQTGLSRRGFLRGVGAGGAAIAGAGLLSACGDDGTETDGGTVTDQSDVDKTLNFANWQLYIDQISKDIKAPGTTLNAFEKETGITVNYTDPINDNESFFATVRPILASDSATPYDCFVLTDWMASKMINLDYLQKLDKSNIPNADNLTATLKSPSWDPNRDYSMPWQSGLTGIAYDASQIGEVSTINQLLTDPELAGVMTVLTEMRDTMGLIMLDQGNDPENFDQAAWDQAFAAIQEATDNQQIRQFTGNNYSKLLAAGDIKACIAWSGDVIQLQYDNDNIKFVVPDAGAMLWSDNMLVPNLASHKKNAELFMDYYYDPKVAAQLASWVNYICPVDGAQKEMEKIAPALVDEPLIFPSPEDLEKVSLFRALTPDEDTQYTTEYQTLFT